MTQNVLKNQVYTYACIKERKKERKKITFIVLLSHYGFDIK